MEHVRIIGQTADDKSLEPLTDAEGIIKALGFRPNTTIEQGAETNQISWVVQSIGTAVKGGLKDGNKNG